MTKITPSVKVFSAAAALAALLCAPGMAHAGDYTDWVSSQYETAQEQAEQAGSAWSAAVDAAFAAQQAYDDCTRDPTADCDAQSQNWHDKDQIASDDYTQYQQLEDAARDLGNLLYSLQAN